MGKHLQRCWNCLLPHLPRSIRQQRPAQGWQSVQTTGQQPCRPMAHPGQVSSTYRSENHCPDPSPSVHPVLQPAVTSCFGSKVSQVWTV